MRRYLNRLKFGEPNHRRLIALASMILLSLDILLSKAGFMIVSNFLSAQIGGVELRTFAAILLIISASWVYTQGGL